MWITSLKLGGLKESYPHQTFVICSSLGGKATYDANDL